MVKKPQKVLAQFVVPLCSGLVVSLNGERSPFRKAPLLAGFFVPRKLVSQILFLDDHLSNAPDFDTLSE